MRALIGLQFQRSIVQSLTVSHFSHDIAMTLFEIAVKPGFSYAPVPLDGFWGDAQNLCSLFDGQSAEEAQFDDLALPWIESREPIQRFI